MKKGYILALSLKLLIIVSSVFIIRYNQVRTTFNVYSDVNFLYSRLAAEKHIFDEILHRLYIYDDDNFIDMYEDFHFDVEISETNITVKVNHLNQYKIYLTYEDDCLCFTEILYK